MWEKCGEGGERVGVGRNETCFYSQAYIPSKNSNFSGPVTISCYPIFIFLSPIPLNTLINEFIKISVLFFLSTVRCMYMSLKHVKPYWPFIHGSLMRNYLTSHVIECASYRHEMELGKSIDGFYMWVTNYDNYFRIYDSLNNFSNYQHFLQSMCLWYFYL